ncbi:hypothetical protein Pint_07827 [Pistacia integerrima]|uniref:Uncharacterized protein n=1 Tax=Pistacia integerrima TaxID=434235 RepID=A0ACC0XRR1_9ROSI|nr:hypothetical protein Pint_07827 [Pistacia integerrima]
MNSDPTYNINIAGDIKQMLQELGTEKGKQTALLGGGGSKAQKERATMYLCRNFMIQGGDPTGIGKGGESIWGKPFKDEVNSKLLHSGRGVVSMANSGPHTNGSQFFNLYKSANHLNFKHTFLGGVVDGLTALAAMEKTARRYSSDDPNQKQFDHFNVTAIFQYTGNYTPSSPYFPSALPNFKDNHAAVTFTERFRSLASQDHPVNVPKNITTRMFVVASMGMEFCPNKSCDGYHGNRNLSGVYKTNFPDDPANPYNYTGENLDVYKLMIPVVDTRVKVLVVDTRVKVLACEEVEIVFQGTNAFNASEAHPFHLRGHSF